MSFLENWIKLGQNSSSLSKLDSLEDFDLLLFHGQGAFSYLIEWGSWSNFSHVALVLQGAVEIEPGLTGIYMLESGRETIPDVVENRIKFGVQITNLEEVVKNYDGTVYHRRLNISSEVRKSLKEKLADIYTGIGECTYDYNPLDFIRADLGIDWGDCEKTDEFFCSALVCYVWSKLGLLDPEFSWDLIRPKDFRVGGSIEGKLLNRVTLGSLETL